MTHYLTSLIKKQGRNNVVYESTSVEIFMDWDKRVGRLSNLFSVVRGNGYASKLLNDICDWADENRIDLWLVAKPFGVPRGALDQNQLIDFYEKFGFHQIPGESRNTLQREAR